jgi:hypothetical protein
VPWGARAAPGVAAWHAGHASWLHGTPQLLVMVDGSALASGMPLCLLAEAEPATEALHGG